MEKPTEFFHPRSLPRSRAHHLRRRPASSLDAGARGHLAAGADADRAAGGAIPQARVVVGMVGVGGVGGVGGLGVSSIFWDEDGSRWFRFT